MNPGTHLRNLLICMYVLFHTSYRGAEIKLASRHL